MYVDDSSVKTLRLVRKISKPFSDMQEGFVESDIEEKRAGTAVKQVRHLP